MTGSGSESRPYGSPLEALSAQLAQLREQQVATNEVLLAVGRSDFELQPIFETVVEQAIRLCQADAGQIFVKEGDHFRLACASGGSEEYRSLIGERDLPLGPGTLVGRVALERRPVMSADISHDRKYDTEEQRLRQQLGGFRTIVGVPIQSNEEVMAVISLWRREVNPFTERAIELATTFAAQGAIAIRNASLMQQLVPNSHRVRYERRAARSAPCHEGRASRHACWARSLDRHLAGRPRIASSNRGSRSRSRRSTAWDG